jgi:hypothetical protein
MNASELEHIWKRQGPIALSQERLSAIAASVGRADRKFRRKIWWRDLREIGAVLLIVWFSVIRGQTWLRWISVASALFIAAVLIWSRLVLKSPPRNSSVIARLHQMIRETEMQIRLLRSVVWWYLLPCGIGAVALALDHSPRKFDISKLTSSHLLTFAMTMALLSVGVYLLNQRAVRTVFEPRRARLRHALAEIEEHSAL